MAGLLPFKYWLTVLKWLEVLQSTAKCYKSWCYLGGSNEYINAPYSMWLHCTDVGELNFTIHHCYGPRHIAILHVWCCHWQPMGDSYDTGVAVAVQLWIDWHYGTEPCLILRSKHSYIITPDHWAYSHHISSTSNTHNAYQHKSTQVSIAIQTWFCECAITLITFTCSTDKLWLLKSSAELTWYGDIAVLWLQGLMLSSYQ